MKREVSRGPGWVEYEYPSRVTKNAETGMVECEYNGGRRVRHHESKSDLPPGPLMHLVHQLRAQVREMRENLHAAGRSAREFREAFERLDTKHIELRRQHEQLQREASTMSWELETLRAREQGREPEARPGLDRGIE